MATPGVPQNLVVQSANLQILVSWDLSAGADSYIVQRSEDNITFTTLATISGTPLATSYLDTSPELATTYWYKVAAKQGSDTSSYTTAQSAVAVPTGEMTLGQIRLAAQQRADRVGSDFVTKAEWNGYINKAAYELYDLLITVYEDYYLADPVQFTVDGTSPDYTLPNGILPFLNNATGVTEAARPFYKLLGVDLALNNTTNAFVTINKYNFIDRNNYVYPNTASTIYGVFNLRYRVMGNKIRFIPTPAAGQAIQLWYIPRLTELLQDTDTTDISISGWVEYVIVRAAKYALDKEESDSSKLDQEILFLKARIEESAANRDAGQPDTISDSRSTGGWGNPYGNGGGSGRGGW